MVSGFKVILPLTSNHIINFINLIKQNYYGTTGNSKRNATDR